MKEAIEYLKYKEIVKNKEINAYLETVSYTHLTAADD